MFRNSRVWSALVVMGVVLGLALSSCAPAAPPPPEEMVDFIFAQGADVTKTDPTDVTDGESIRVCNQLYDGLVRFTPGKTTVEPNLATEWTTSEDGLVWEFKLRDDVKFHDGTDFNAEAVVYNSMRQLDPDHPEHTGVFEYWEYMFGGFLGDVDDDGNPTSVVKSVEAVDEYTVRFNMNRPLGPFIQDMAMFYMYQISPTALKEQGENYGLPAYTPAGTGPFKFVEWVEGDHITLERYDDYHGDVAKINRVLIRIIPDNAARYLALQAGDIHGMGFPNPDDVPNCEADENCQVLLRPPNTTAFINIMTDREPWDDANVRKALSLAIDKQAIVDSLYGGLGIVATQYVPPSLWGHNPDIEDYGYDPDEARRLLQEAGVEEGFTFDFWYMPNPRPYYPVPEDIAEAIASYWADVGLNPQLKTEDWSTYLDDRNAGVFDVWMLGWTGDNGDPDNFFCYFVCIPKPKEGNWNTEKAQQAIDLLLQAQALSSQAEREPLYQQAAVLVHEDAKMIFMAHNETALLFNPGVKGFVPSPLGEEFYNTVYFEE
jgi:peptide/nickel transport system substrate-binding protein